MVGQLDMTFVPTPAIKFGPRVGKLILTRPSGVLEIQTPGIFTASSRGVVPHLSIDHVRSIPSIRWINIPFESFLEQPQPLPTLQDGVHPLHKYLGFDAAKHIVSMCSRNPADVHEMPPNGNNHLAVRCVRGVRKMTKDAWRSYAHACQPDFVVALSDTPFTPPPFSQRRMIKSIDRSLTWLADLLKPEPHLKSQVLVHMAGGLSHAARKAFTHGLLEQLQGKEAETIKPLKCLDEGVVGYVFDLAPLRHSSLEEKSPAHNPGPLTTSALLSLLHISLDPLPAQKLRQVNSTTTPHEILHLIQSVGVDLFDASWAQRAAHIGVALDFAFPVRFVGRTGPRQRSGGKWDLGHNLFMDNYADDFERLSESLLDGMSSHPNQDRPTCDCIGCSPVSPSTRISHSLLDEANDQTLARLQPPLSRAYLYHLLQTHEMSSHSILVAHNLSVVDSFLGGVRVFLSNPDTRGGFSQEVEKFCETYDDTGALFEEAHECWKDVDLARGKGRLAREREKEKVKEEVVDGKAGLVLLEDD